MPAALVLGEFIHRHDVGMIERGGRLGLVLEAGFKLGVLREVRGQELECDVAVEAGVLRQEDLPHTPFAQLRTNQKVQNLGANHGKAKMLNTLAARNSSY